MNWLDEEKNVFLPVYNRFPIVIDHGEGVYLYDTGGKAYLDLLAGIAVNALGHNHPAILKAVQSQLHRNLHLSNYFIQDIQVELAAAVLGKTPFSKLFFTNSGTEAVEGLLKLVKKWARMHNKTEIVAFQGSFHGRSLGALSITIQEKYQKNFHPLLQDIKYVPYNDTRAMEQVLSERTAAVFYEGITGEGGIHAMHEDMTGLLGRKREEYGFLLIQDEIQTGVGRTGTFYHYEQLSVVPDAIATAKGLGGGLPLGAFLVSEDLVQVFERGEHGTTYGGNPLACASGLAVVRTVTEDAFLKRVQESGFRFREMLTAIAENYPDDVTEVRGRGLMLGLEVNKSVKELLHTGLRNGLLFNIAGGNTLRFVPPLILEDRHIDEAHVKLTKTFKDVFKQ